MRGFAHVAYVVVALCLTVLTFALGSQVHQLRGQMANCGARLDAATERLAAGAAETREQRIARRVREIREASDESAEVLRRLLTTERQSGGATSRPSPTLSDRDDRRPNSRPQ